MHLWGVRQKTESADDVMLRATVENAPELIAVVRKDGRFCAFSRLYKAEFKKVFGIDLAPGDNLVEVVAGLSEQQTVLEIFNRTMRGENFTVIQEFGDNRIDPRTYEIHCFPIYDDDGILIGGTHIARDITELRKAEAALRVIEENQRRLIENSSDCIKVLDLQGRVLSINPVGQRLMELDDNGGKYIGQLWADYWQGKVREQAEAALDRARAGGIGQFSALGLTIKGNVRWWEETISPVLDAEGRTVQLIVVARDVTEQKQHEEELSRREEEFRTFFESASGGKVLADAETGRFQRVNEMMCNLTGYSADELLGMTFLDILHPQDRDWQMNLYRQHRDSTVAGYAVEKRYLRKDGSALWVHVNVDFQRNESGKAMRAFAVIQDIAEIKKAQEALEAAKEEAEEGRRLLDVLMDNVPEGIVIADAPDFKVRMVSRFGQVFYPPHGDINEMADCKRLYHADGVTPLQFDDFPLVRAVRENKVLDGVEIVYVGPQGERKFHRCNAAPIRDANGSVTGGIVVWHEVTGQRQAEEAIRDERAFLRQVIDATPSMIFVKDWEGRFVLVNESLATAYGSTTDEIVGKTDADLNPNTEEVEHFLRDDREVMRTRKVKLIPEERVTFATGEVHWFSTIKVPLLNPDGTCNKLLGVASDITVRRWAETALRRFRIALDSAADNIFLIDPQTMRFLDVSQSVCRDLGYKRDELLKLGPSDIMPQVSREDLDRLFSEVKSEPEGKGVLETVHYRKNGTGFEVEVLLRPAVDQGRTMFVAVARDITARKQTEMRMKQINEKLAEADRRKDEFLAMLAHELRNPLAPIRNAVQVLRLALPEEPILLRQRDIIDRQVAHMARLLDDLLDVSRITRGNINLKNEVVKLSDVFARAVESANPLIESRRHTLSITPPTESMRVGGDFDRLIQVVGNLLSNSAKYTEPGGKIWLVADREDDDYLVIRVRDTGVGIAPDMLPRIFDVFTQVSRSLDRSQGGLGLGLTLVRTLVEMHKGRVEAHSEGLGKGSEFVVRLPALPDETQYGESSDVHSASKEARRRRILVVDDVADTANSLAELLGLLGHEVRTGFDGPSVINLAREFQPDVILLDIGLPGENGYEVARKIRRDPELKDVVLVALTGYGQDEDRRQAEDAGFNHLFTKPVELSALESFLTQTT